MSIKIVVDDKIPFIKGRLEEVADVVYAPGSRISAEMVKDADAIVTRTRTCCDSRLLNGAKVGIVVTATIGTDHIDIPWCRANGIEVANAPGCNAPAVAQYIWASILRLQDPAGMKLGVIGYGNVGSVVGEWGKALGAEISVYDPFLERTGACLPFKSLGRLLAESDVVTLHVPLTKSPAEFPTFHMIGSRELSLMKKGAILMNAARGPVVDGNALKHILTAGDIRAVIDTWENEPGIDRELLRLPLVATPHIAGYSKEGKERGTRMAIEALERHFGFEIDKSGLCGPHTTPENIDPEEILKSYNPAKDTRVLRSNPQDFEALRENYDYRSEPFIE